MRFERPPEAPDRRVHRLRLRFQLVLDRLEDIEPGERRLVELFLRHQQQLLELPDPTVGGAPEFVESVGFLGQLPDPGRAQEHRVIEADRGTRFGPGAEIALGRHADSIGRSGASPGWGNRTQPR